MFISLPTILTRTERVSIVSMQLQVSAALEQNHARLNLIAMLRSRVVRMNTNGMQ